MVEWQKRAGLDLGQRSLGSSETSAPELPTLVIDKITRVISINGKIMEVKGDIDWQMLLALVSAPDTDIATSRLREVAKKAGSRRKDGQAGTYIRSLRELMEQNPNQPAIITTSGNFKLSTYRLRAKVRIIESHGPDTQGILIVKDKEKKKDLGEKEAKAAYALFALNQDRSGFENVFIKDIVLKVYSDKFSGILDQKDKERIIFNHVNHYFPPLQTAIAEKLRDAWPLLLDVVRICQPNLAGFIEWLKRQPEYANASIEDLTLVVRRQISFADLKKRIEAR